VLKVALLKLTNPGPLVVGSIAMVNSAPLALGTWLDALDWATLMCEASR
jgi:hypothetical protein